MMDDVQMRLECTVEVPPEVARVLLRDQERGDTVRIHQPVIFTSGEAGEHEYTYNLHAVARWTLETT